MQAVQNRGLQEEILDLFRLPGEYLFRQVVDKISVAAAEGLDQGLRLSPNPPGGAEIRVSLRCKPSFNRSSSRGRGTR